MSQFVCAVPKPIHNALLYDDDQRRSDPVPKDVPQIQKNQKNRMVTEKH